MNAVNLLDDCGFVQADLSVKQSNGLPLVANAPVEQFASEAIRQ
jgi:hypothetical protein